jgi:Phage portal protein, lambda family
MNPILKPFRAALRAFIGPPVASRGSGHGKVQGASPTIVTGGGGGYFAALRNTNDRTPVPIYSAEVRGYVDSLSRQTLGELGAYLYDNNGVVSYAVDTLCNYSAPVMPQAASDDDDWNTAAEEYFEQWAERAEFTGRFDFAETQRQVCKAMLTAGDVLAVFTSESGVPQIQLIDGWRIRNHSQPDNCRDGVQTDSKGRVTGYFVEDGESSKPVSADHCFFAADLDRAASYRGLTPLRRGMNDIRDVDDLKSLEKLAQKVRASLPAVLEGDAPIQENVWGDDEANAPAADATAHEKKLTLAELLGGDIPDLPNGKKLKVLTEQRDAMPVTDFIAALSAYFVYGLGIPPAFFLDTKGTGPNTRSVNGKAQRVFDRYKKIFCRFTLWTWRRVIGDAIATGALPSNPRWDKLAFQTPAKVSIDTGDEETADREALIRGFRTRQEVWGKRGGDWMSGTKQVVREHRFIIAQAKALSEETGVPLPILLAAHGFDSAKAQVTPPAEQVAP